MKYKMTLLLLLTICLNYTSWSQDIPFSMYNYVIGNALPKQTADMIRTCLSGDFKSAQKAHSQLIDFTRLMFVEGSPAGVKTALKHLGICSDTLRLPLVQVSSGIAEKIIAETRKFS